jgi:DHA2 family multidrug resistance protein
MAAAANPADAGWTPDRSAAGHRNPWLIVIVISLATFMEVLDTAIANVSLIHISGSLSVTPDQATWILTSYLVANAVIVPISGWLADTFGRKRYYMASVALFTVSSLMCGLAPNLVVLIIARVFQGIGGGGLAASEQSILADTFPPSKRGAAFAAYGLVVVTAPTIGPTLGGYITDNATWHWIFLINVPVGILSLFLVGALMAEPPALVRDQKARKASGIKVDWIGFLLVAVGLGCLEITLDRGEREDWFQSGFIVSFAIISAVSLILFVIWELSRKNPIVNVRLLGQRNFSIAVFVMMVLGIILFGTTQLIPQFLQQVLGYTATDAGRALTTGGMVSVLMMPLAGLASSKIPARFVIFGALLIEAFALWDLGRINSTISFGDASLARLFQALGLPFLFVTITGAAYVGLKPQDTNQASALLNVFRNLGGTFGIAYAQSTLAQQQQFHQSTLVANAQALDPNYASTIDRISDALRQAGSDTGNAVGVLFSQIQTQASTLAFIDVFRNLMVFVLIVAPFSLLLRPSKGRPAAH